MLLMPLVGTSNAFLLTTAPPYATSLTHKKICFIKDQLIEVEIKVRQNQVFKFCQDNLTEFEILSNCYDQLNINSSINGT